MQDRRPPWGVSPRLEGFDCSVRMARGSGKRNSGTVIANPSLTGEAIACHGL